MDSSVWIALLAQLPALATQLMALYNNIAQNLGEDDKAKLEAELARLRAEMPADMARVNAALDAAIARGD